MELYTKTTRFCLLCNYVSRIIDPITSRTAKFRFRLLPRDIQMAQIERIRTAEQVNINDNAVEQLISGDLRNINTDMHIDEFVFFVFIQIFRLKVTSQCSSGGGRHATSGHLPAVTAQTSRRRDFAR